MNLKNNYMETNIEIFDLPSFESGVQKCLDRAELLCVGVIPKEEVVKLANEFRRLNLLYLANQRFIPPERAENIMHNLSAIHDAIRDEQVKQQTKKAGTN